MLEASKLRQAIYSLLACISLFSTATTYAEPPSELVFLTWPEYIDPELVSEFELQHNVKIRFVYFQSDDYRDQIVLDADGRGFDIAIVNGLKIHAYNKYGWLEAIDESNTPNLQHASDKWRSLFKDAQHYASPYLWGTVGIAYRADLAPEPITNWIQLYRPHKLLQNRIVMIDSNREVVGLALKALGYSMNTHNLAEIKEAESLVYEQSEFVKAYSYITLTETSSLVTGEAYAAFAYSGDALSLMEFEPNIKYVLPQEGSILWCDYTVVFKQASNKEMAFKFVNYLQEPKNAARLALYSNFATPNTKAEALLPDEFLNNSVIYPPQDTLAKSEADEELPIRIAKEYARIMVDVTEN